MKKLNDIFSLFEDLISIGFFIVGFILMMYEVIMRYFFNHPTAWINEVSTIIIVWAVLLGMSLTLREGRHIKVDLLYVLLPNGLKRFLDYFSNIVGALFCIAFTYYGMDNVSLALSSGQLSVETSIPMWIYFLVIPISGFMFLVRFIENIVKINKNIEDTTELNLIIKDVKQKVESR